MQCNLSLPPGGRCRACEAEGACVQINVTLAFSSGEGGNQRLTDEERVACANNRLSPYGTAKLQLMTNGPIHNILNLIFQERIYGDERIYHFDSDWNVV